MTDAFIPPVPAASATTEALAPATATPSATPADTTSVVAAASAAAEVSAPVVAPVADATVEAAPATLLGTDPTPVTSPVVDPAAPIANVEPVVAQPAEPVIAPSYDAWVVPEGVELDTAQAAEFASLLGDFESTAKIDHAEAQKFGQSLVEYHIKQVQQLQERQAQAWEAQKSEWLNQFKSDPELGGNRQDTTVNAALDFIRTHGGTPEQQAEFKQVMNISGLGNHPAVIRLLAKANMAMREGSPVAGTHPVQPKTSKIEKFYGTR